MPKPRPRTVIAQMQTRPADQFLDRVAMIISRDERQQNGFLPGERDELIDVLEKMRARIDELLPKARAHRGNEKP